MNLDPALNKPDYTSLDLPPAPPDRPCVLVNMVMSADGKAVIDGTERGLGSKVDQRLMRELRVHADIVLNGASTLRVSGASPRLGDAKLEYLREARGKPRLPAAAIMTASGDVPLDKAFFTASDFEAFVYVGAEAPRGVIDAIVGTGRAAVRLPAIDEVRWMLAHMRHEIGAEVLLLEGGPTINAQFFAGGFVDEYFVTIGSVLVGGQDSLTPIEGPAPFPREVLPKLSLISAVPNRETSEIYLRYRVLHE